MHPFIKGTEAWLSKLTDSTDLLSGIRQVSILVYYYNQNWQLALAPYREQGSEKALNERLGVVNVLPSTTLVQYWLLVFSGMI